MIRPSIDRRVAAVLALLGCLLLASFATVAAINALNTALLERDAKADLAEQLRRTTPDSRRASPDGQADLQIPFVEAETETLAAAQIDSLVRAAVLRADGTVLSSRAEVKHEESERTRRIEVDLVVQGHIGAMQRMLFALETGAPFVFVDALSIQPVEGAVDKRRPGTAMAPVLQAALTLSAYWRGAP
jgi:general secretion pathway protein M